MFSPRNFAAVIQLRRVLREEKYDMISVHTSLAAFFTRLAVMTCGKQRPIVMNTAHGYLFDRRYAAAEARDSACGGAHDRASDRLAADHEPSG